MLSADSLEKLAVYLSLRAVHRIATENLCIVHVGDHIPELFHSNLQLSTPSRPQRRVAFSADCNPGTVFCRGLCCCGNEFARELQKTSRIQPVMRHDSREGVGSIQRPISLLLYSDVHFYTVQAQSPMKARSMEFSRHNN